jgi:4-hydroxybenzoate polyprenyltransferase
LYLLKKFFSKDNFILLRLHFSFFLLPVFLVSFSMLQVPNTNHVVLLGIILHFLVYPSSNAYNSYIDQDTSSIGGVEQPPLANKSLFYITIVLDCVALFLLYFYISVPASLLVFMYIMGSRLYSAPVPRLKQYAFISWFFVALFQGAFIAYLVQAIGYNNYFNFNTQNLSLYAASFFQLAGSYPLTQIYQHQNDKAQGIETISIKLGLNGTFAMSILCFLLSNVFYFFLLNQNHFNLFILLQIVTLPIMIYFLWWFKKVHSNIEFANFKYTSYMVLIASVCYNVCFSLFCIFK